jgi:hypothetical protein
VAFGFLLTIPTPHTPRCKTALLEHTFYSTSSCFESALPFTPNLVVVLGDCRAGCKGLACEPRPSTTVVKVVGGSSAKSFPKRLLLNRGASGFVPVFSGASVSPDRSRNHFHRVFTSEASSSNQASTFSVQIQCDSPVSRFEAGEISLRISAMLSIGSSKSVLNEKRRIQARYS